MTVSMRHLPMLLAIAACALTASCTSEHPEPPAQTTSTSSAQPPTTTRTAPSTTFPPTVTRVLDITPYANRPCTLLTPQQRAALGLTFEKGQSESQDGKLCYLDGRPTPPTDVMLHMYIQPGWHDPSSWSDRVKPPKGRWTTIGGQPAATYDSSRYDCYAMVWIAPDQGIEVRVGSDDIMEERDDWCERATAVLEPIVANLVG